MLNLRSTLLPLTLLLAAGAVDRLSAQNDLNVPAGTNLTLNESASYQNVTVGTGATLETIDANSGGAGDHAIIITLAAYGAGTIQNDGIIELAGNDLSNTTVFANPITLSGSGTLEVYNINSNVQGPGTLTQAVGHTLTGGGGPTGDTGPSFSAPLVNHGLVTTNDLGFVLNGASLVNDGTFSASNGAALYLDAPTLNNTNGTITVGDANSVVIIENGVAVTGGTLQCTVPGTIGNDYGVFKLQGGASLANLTIAANAGVKVEDTGALAGTVTNDGFLLVPNYLTLNLAGNATLAGSGTLHLSGHLEGANNATLTINPGQILQLEGSANTSGAPDIIDASVVNNGTLAGVYQSGLINSAFFTNNGLLAANNNATVSIEASTNFTNYHAGTQTLTGGTYTVTDQGNGATLDFGGRSVLVNAAAIALSGASPRFDALNGLANNEGSLSLLALEQFTTSTDLTNAGTINLDAGTTLHVGGTFTSGESSTLAVTLGGTQTSGAQSPGVLQVGGAATVGGNLTLSFATGAALPANGDTLTVVSAGSPVQGSFGNVPSRARLATTDGQGSFRVSYGAAANTVILSDFLLPGQADTTPTVTLSVVTPSIGVASGQDGEFLLTLSAVQTNDVVVNYTIKSTATNGTDYVALSGAKKIKAGKTSKPIKVIPQGTLEGARKRTVVLTLQPGNGYQVGTAGKVKVKIID